MYSFSWRRFTKSRAAELDQRAHHQVAAVSEPSQPRSIVDFVRWMAEDISSVRERDPAARSRLEVVLAYPGLHALWLHRPTHLLWRRGLTVLPRVISYWNRFLTGVDIHPGAVLGRGVFIDHAMGVVIGETAVVGDECLIYQGAVLGGTSLERKVRHPRLGAQVVVGANACVLGAISIGDGARVGSNSVVIRDVPADATVVGVPGKVLRRSEGQEPIHDTPHLLDHANLPDPVAELVHSLLREIERLSTRLAALEGHTPASPNGAGRDETP